MLHPVQVTVRDLWAHANLTDVVGTLELPDIRTHQTRVVLLCPSTTEDMY